MISSISILAIAALGIFALRLGTIYSHTRNPYHLMLSISAVAGAITVLAWMNPPWLNTTGIHEHLYIWARALSAACLLSAAAWLIYRLKPQFARFPAFFCFLPFILLLVLPALLGGSVLKEIVFLIYQGGAGLILVLLYSNQLEGNKGNLLILLGVIISGLSIILYLMPDIWLKIPHYVVPVPLILGVIMASFGFDVRYKELGAIIDENSIQRNLQTEDL